MPDIPDGVEHHFRRSGLANAWEQLYFAQHRRGAADGLADANIHANSRGFVHGGLIVALADNAMGLICAQRFEQPTNLVTVTLTLDYLSSARIGQ